MAKTQTGKRIAHPSAVKAEALRRTNSGESITDVARDLKISSGVVYTWRSNAKKKAAAKRASKPNGHAIVRAEYLPAEAASEAAALRREIALLREENDILTKTIMVFARRRA